MQRIFNISKWSLIPTGKAMQFPGDRPRKVVLEVNSTGRTELVMIANGGSHFLALVEGRDTVEFYTPGPFAIASAGSDCYIYTADGDGMTFTATDSESFAVIREKRERNFELEVIAARMTENMNRRLREQAHELERILERRAAAFAAQHPNAGVAERVSQPPVGADDGAAAGKPKAPRARSRSDVGGDGDPAS